VLGKPLGKRPIGRPRRKRERHINVDLREIGCEVVRWMELAQDRVQLLLAVLNLRVL